MSRKTEKMGPSPFWKRLIETWGHSGLPTTQTGIARVLRDAGHEVKGQSTTQRWHDGTSLPGKTSILIALADKGHTTIDFLLFGRLPKYPERPDALMTELHVIWDIIDPAGKTHVLEAARGQAARSAGVRAVIDQKSANRKTGP